MIVPDINLLLYAHDSASRRHQAARAWWEALMNGTETVGLPWIAILGFIRISTHAKILDNPLDVGGACRRVRSWLDRPQTALIHPGTRHADILFGLIEAVGTPGDLTPDAHLAASQSNIKPKCIPPTRTWRAFQDCVGRIRSSEPPHDFVSLLANVRESP